MSIQLASETLRQLELLKLRTRRNFLGTRQGGHISLKRGHGIEFSDYRKYELGDDPRHIDWGVYGRTDRLYLKRFQEEQDLSIAIIIDNSASMFNPVQDQKWLRACQLALALAYVGLMQQDRVILIVPNQLDSGFTSGAAAYGKLVKQLSKIQQATTDNFVTNSRKILGRLSHPGLAFIISDFLMPFEDNQKLLQGLQNRNLEINAIQTLGKTDLELYDQLDLVAVDSESGYEHDLLLDETTRSKYQQLLNEHNLKLQNYCSRHSIKYIQCDCRLSLASLILAQFTQTGLFQ